MSKGIVTEKGLELIASDNQYGDVLTLTFVAKDGEEISPKDIMDAIGAYFIEYYADELQVDSEYEFVFPDDDDGDKGYN